MITRLDQANFYINDVMTIRPPNEHQVGGATPMTSDGRPGEDLT
jgi:hypothetical protein